MKRPQKDFLLGEPWLCAYVHWLDEREPWLTDQQVVDRVNAWTLAVVSYVRWLDAEGVDVKETARIVNAAVDESDFDLAKFPRVPGDD